MFEDAPKVDLGVTSSPLDGADAKSGKKTWEVLSATNASYKTVVDEVTKVEFLYEGGFQMNTEAVAKLFCPQLKADEDSPAFKRRIESASYTPTYAKLITGLLSNLYSQELEVMEQADHNDASTMGEEFVPTMREFYKDFVSDVDGNGTSLHNFMKNRTVKALNHQKSYFGIDYPKASAEPQNLLEQEPMGLLNPILYYVEAGTVLDYKLIPGSDHLFEWIKLGCWKQHQPTPFDPAMIKCEIKTWQMKNGKAHYQTYLTRAVKAKDDMKKKEIVPLVDEGDTSFDMIPIFCFYHDEGVAVGKRLAPMAAELFNRSTIENHYTNIACIPVPVQYNGDMLPGDLSLPNPVMLDSDRGRRPLSKVNNNGVLQLGKFGEDSFEIVESTGKALGFIHEQNMDLDQRMHSVIHQMGQSLKQASVKSTTSAISKQEDRRSMEMLLTAIADEVFKMTEMLMAATARSRGEDIEWDVKGLQTTEQVDRTELTVEAGLLDTINSCSPTFSKEYTYRIYSSLIEGTDQLTLQTVRKEIEEAMDGAEGEQLMSGIPAAQQATMKQSDDQFAQTIQVAKSSKATDGKK